jgi:O-antigen/teichoic acid export membrane protein
MAVVYGHIVGHCFTLLVCLPVVLKYATWKFSPGMLREPLKYGYPMVVMGYSNVIIRAGERYVLRILGTMGTVGVYSFGRNIGSFLNLFLVQPLRQALRPIVLKLEGEPEEQKAFLQKCSVYYALAAIFIALAMSMHAKDIIMLMARRKSFWPSWGIIPVVAMGYVLHGLGDFFKWGLVMPRKPHLISGTVLACAILHVALCFALIPFLGFMGAAWSMLCTYIVWDTLYLHFAKKYYELTFPIFRITKLMLVAVILYFAGMAAASTPYILLNLLVKALILLAYPGLLLITRCFTAEEKDFLRKFSNEMRAKGLRGTIERLRSA